MATRDLRSYFTSVSKDKKASHGSCTSIPRLVKATGNVTAADASAVSKKKLENIHTPTKQKLLLNALNQSTLTTLFYVRL